MAALTDAEKTKIRRWLASQSSEVTWSKTQLNAAAQAVEDLLDGATLIVAGDVGKGLPAIFSEDIDAAMSPATLTGAQKKKIGAMVFEAKFLRDK